MHYTYTPLISLSLSNVVLVDILFLNLPFCIYFDLMLPSMSFQCTVYTFVWKISMRFTFQSTHNRSFGIPLFHPRSRVRFVLVFACSLFLYVIHKYTNRMYILKPSFGQRILVSNVHFTFLPINCEFAMRLIFVYICKFICLSCACASASACVSDLAGKFNMKIASIHKLQMK